MNSRLAYGWGQRELPLVGRVSVIDNGEPAVGLSAMQMDAVGVAGGVVALRKGEQRCLAHVWNAYGTLSSEPMTTKGDGIRISSAVAQELHCGIGDDIEFVQVVSFTSPVRVRLER